MAYEADAAVRPPQSGIAAAHTVCRSHMSDGMQELEWACPLSSKDKNRKQFFVLKCIEYME